MLRLILFSWSFALFLFSIAKCDEEAVDSNPQDLLLIVGDVRPRTARILFENRRKVGSGNFMNVKVSESLETPNPIKHTRKSIEYNVIQHHKIDLAPEGEPPQALTLSNLTPNRIYSVIFAEGEVLARVTFRTPLESIASLDKSLPKSIFVASCDRYIDDKDDLLWKEMAKDVEMHLENFEYFGMAHIGDQIYADAGKASIKIPSISDKERRDEIAIRSIFKEVLEEFRQIYRKTLGRPSVQRILRAGANWMIPDDHEIINNLNKQLLDSLSQPFQFGKELYIRAGLQVMYEYEYQIRQSFPFERIDFLMDSIEEILSEFPWYFDVLVDSDLKFFFMDLRFDAAVIRRQSDERLLMRSNQMETLNQTLQKWGSIKEENKSRIVLFSSLPLFLHNSLSAWITDFVEKEKYPGHQDLQIGLTGLGNMFFSNKVDLLIGGDIHTLVHSRVCRYQARISTVSHNRRCINQLITSGTTKGSTAIQDLKLVPFYLFVTRFIPEFNWIKDHLFFSTHQEVIEYERVFFGRNYG
jgi:hypothetical protein